MKLPYIQVHTNPVTQVTTVKTTPVYSSTVSEIVKVSCS